MLNEKKKSTTKKKKASKKKSKIDDKVSAIKVENEDAVRDPNSGAVVYNNQREHQQAVRKQRSLMTNKRNDGEIRSLQKQVAQLSLLVEQMINKNKEDNTGI